jgi:hypothetical protein
MILFKNDWKKYPTAQPDFDTKNKSFLRLAQLYRAMGVKNHTFILALVNPELKGVDPHDPALTKETMTAIAIECQINPWYFFREVVVAPAIAGVSTNQLEGNRGNIALFWCFFVHLFIFLIQPRQTGKSFNSDVLDSYLLNIGCQNSQINLLTKDDVLRRKNVERLRDIMAELPAYLQMRTREDSSNFEEITIKKLGNSFVTHVPQPSIKGAYKLGRGLTSPIMKIDEAPFQPNIEIALGSALAATGAAVDAAKKAGTHYGTVLTTTAGDLNEDGGKYIYGILSEAAPWTEKFLDAEDLDDLKAMVTKNGRGAYRVNCTFNHRQLGKTDEWLLEKIQASTQKGQDADRDFFNRWTTGTSTNPIDKQILNKMSESVRSDFVTTMLPGFIYMMRWYVPENEIERRMQQGSYVFGLDTSDAGGGDNICGCLLDVNTLEIVATMTVNETNLIVFAKWVAAFMVKYLNVTLIVELRSSGQTIVDNLLLVLPEADIDPFKRLYSRVIQEAIPNDPIWRTIAGRSSRRDSDFYVQFKKQFGFTTSGTGMYARSELYSTVLQNAVKLSCAVTYDFTLVNQVGSLVNNNGRIDHPPGGHDDMVIAWLMCHWFVSSGKNLAYYGIQQVMGNIQYSGLKPVAAKARLSDEQLRIRHRIQEVYEMLTVERDEFLIMRLEQELKSLDSRIVLEEGDIYSIDELLKQSKENRRRRYNQQIKETPTLMGYTNLSPTKVTVSQYSDRPMYASQF